VISAVAEGRDLKALVTLDEARVTGHLGARRDLKTSDALRGKRLGVDRIGTDFRGGSRAMRAPHVRLLTASVEAGAWHPDTGG
jgi:hypothetical protein